MNPPPETDFPALIPATREIWEENACWWDSNMGEGNQWHLTMIAPSTERLLSIRPGESVLDLACGNGQFARRLASLGAAVLACDFSPAMLERARSHGPEHSGHIDYRLMDLTVEEQLATLGVAQFEAAVCTMALMDIASITPVLRAVRRSLKPAGRFVFSVPHPCFNTNGTTLMAVRNDFDESEGVPALSVNVRTYRGLAPQRAIGIPGQPQPHFYFHRPLYKLLGACFEAGLALDGIEEPSFGGAARDYSVRWHNCPEIPPVLVARLHPLP